MTIEALPIAEFVEHRRREIGLGKADVVRRCGYKSLSKGLRRLDALKIGARPTGSTIVYGCGGFLVWAPFSCGPMAMDK